MDLRNVLSVNPGGSYQRSVARSWPGIAIFLGVIVALAGVVCFYNLDGRSISRADESLYARSAQEMLQNSSWVPTLHESPFLHKPPLTQLLIKVSLLLFGESTWGYRAPSALAGFIFLLLVPIFAHRISRSRTVSVLSFFAILSCTMLFSSHLIREAVPDGYLILFLLIGLLAGWELWGELSTTKTHSRRAIIIESVFGASVLCAMYAKSVAGLCSLIVWWVFIFVYGWRVLIPVKRTLMVCLLTTFAPIMVFTLSYGILLQSVPGTFGAAIHYEVVEKLVGGGHHNTDRPFYYFLQLFVHERAFPAVVLTAALAFGVSKAIRREASFGYLLISSVIPVIGFSALHSRLYWYIAPIFAPCAVLIGWMLSECLKCFTSYKGYPAKRCGWFVVGSVCSGFLLYSIGVTIHSQLVTERTMELEYMVRTLMMEKKRNPHMKIVRLCLDHKDPYFKSLMLREWLYLDMLKSFSTDMCGDLILESGQEVAGVEAVITTPKFEGMLSSLRPAFTRHGVRIDRWKGIKNKDRVTELVFFRQSRQ